MRFYFVLYRYLAMSMPYSFQQQQQMQQMQAPHMPLQVSARELPPAVGGYQGEAVVVFISSAITDRHRIKRHRLLDQLLQFAVHRDACDAAAASGRCRRTTTEHVIVAQNEFSWTNEATNQM